MPSSSTRFVRFSSSSQNVQNVHTHSIRGPIPCTHIVWRPDASSRFVVGVWYACLVGFLRQRVPPFLHTRITSHAGNKFCIVSRAAECISRACSVGLLPSAYELCWWLSRECSIHTPTHTCLFLHPCKHSYMHSTPGTCRVVSLSALMGRPPCLHSSSEATRREISN